MISYQTEIGGFLSLESYNNKQYYKNAILLNSARNALRYIIQIYKIKELFVPYYTCPVVFNAVEKENCKIEYYDIDKNLMPNKDMPSKSFILYNDYFGMCSGNVGKMAKKYSNIIIDNAQSFYARPKGIACFYSPRKFFGLPDGGILISSNKINIKFDKDASFERILHLVKRIDFGAESAYDEFKINESKLNELPICEMSNLTKLLMGNINYKVVRKIRRRNFKILHDNLKAVNEFNNIIKNDSVPMVYPLLIKRSNLRKQLIENKIYIPKYWEGLNDIIPSASFSNYLVNNLVPIPIDQRYNEKDMLRIVEVINANN